MPLPSPQVNVLLRTPSARKVPAEQRGARAVNVPQWPVVRRDTSSVRLSVVGTDPALPPVNATAVTGGARTVSSLLARSIEAVAPWLPAGDDLEPERVDGVGVAAVGVHYLDGAGGLVEVGDLGAVG